MHRVTGVLFLLLGVGGVVCTCGLLYYFSLSYTDVIFTIKRVFPSVYNIDTIERDFFTYAQWKSSKVIAGIFVCLYTLLVVAGWQQRAHAVTFCQDIRQLLQKARRSFGSQDLLWIDGIILFLAIIHQGYYFMQVPFTVDEVFAYNYFAHQHPIVSAVYYPEPNNHILFNIVASLTDTFALPPVWVMRLPSLVSHLTIVCLLMFYLRMRLSRGVAWLVGFCCSVSFPTTLYALQGRGYMLMSVWALVAVLCIFEWSRSGKLIYVKMFVIASVAGFYTIPTFLYCFIGLVGLIYWLAFTCQQRRKVVSKAILVVGVLTVMAYLPVAGFSGWQALATNRWVNGAASPDRYFSDMFWVEIFETVSFVTGIWHKVYLIGIAGLLAGVWLYTQKTTADSTKKILAFIGFQVLGSVAVMLGMQMLPPLRVWTYLTFWYPVLVGIGLHELSFRFRTPFLFTALSIMMAMVCLHQGYFQYKQQLMSPTGQFSQPTYQKLAQTVAYIVNRNPESVLVNDHWFQFYLRLEQIRHPSPAFRLDTYVPRRNVVYDFIITSPEYPSDQNLSRQLSSGYQPVAEFEESVVYQRVR